MAYLLVVVTATLFTWVLPHVERLRLEHPEFVLGLPLLVLLIWWDRKAPQDVLSTRAEVGAVGSEPSAPVRPVRVAAGFKQIAMTWAAHLVGASVGREAVGLQLGGWAARLRATRGWYVGACLATGFAVVLGTPLAAAVFIFETKKWNLSWTDWVGIPLLAWLGYRFSILVGVTHAEYHSFETTFTELQTIGWGSLLSYALVLIVVCVLLSFLFLHSLARAARRREGVLGFYVLPLIFLGTLAVAYYFVFGVAHVEATGLTGLGTQVFSTLQTIEPDLIALWKHPLLFGVIKVFLTAAFVGIGVRGGELTPLLVAGAMVAVGLAALFHFPVAGFMAIGFSLVWGILARRPIAAAILALEIFGFAPWGLLGIVVFALVWAGMRIGDVADSAVARRFTPKNAVPEAASPTPRIWRRGLYD